MYSRLQKNHQRRQRHRGEQRVSGNVSNVLSLTDVLRIHHFHLDRALITELCCLLNNDLPSQITQTSSLCVATAFAQPLHLFWQVVYRTQRSRCLYEYISARSTQQCSTRRWIKGRVQEPCQLCIRERQAESMKEQIYKSGKITPKMMPTQICSKACLRMKPGMQLRH